MKKWLIVLVIVMAGVAVIGAPKKKGGFNPDKVKNGILLLTFDDNHYADWEATIPIFRKYGAHATFFPSGELNVLAIPSLKKLHGAGHSVGIHTMHHANVPKVFAEKGGDAVFGTEMKPQIDALKKIGVNVTALSYPNNLRNEDTDKYMISKGFKRFRSGHVVRHRGPKVVWTTTDEVFFPVKDIPTHPVMEGVGMGSDYNTDIQDVCNAIIRASKKNEVLVIYSHDISANPSGISTSLDWLEKMLDTAKKNKVQVLGFDELD